MIKMNYSIISDQLRQNCVVTAFEGLCVEEIGNCPEEMLKHQSSGKNSDCWNTIFEAVRLS